LAQSSVPDIAMVSCNPVSFARDANILCIGGYVLKWVEVVDQFRWSPHIEIVAHFHRA
jgi:23S rRNA (uracil1939-C5)-methyltransferase